MVGQPRRARSLLLSSVLDRADDLRGVELLLVGVLDEPDLGELEDDEPLEVDRREEAELAPARRVLHELEHLSGPRPLGEDVALGDLEVGLISDGGIGGPLRPVDGLHGLLELLGHRRLVLLRASTGRQKKREPERDHGTRTPHGPNSSMQRCLLSVGPAKGP
jgi:hypothetical protein